MTPNRRWWTFAIVTLTLFMAMLDNLVVVTALPSIRRALGAGVSDLEWTVNAYTLSFAVLMMIGATLGDRFGRKRIFLLGVAAFTVGSAAAALSSTTSQLEIARAVQGLGAAFLTPLSLTLLARAFPPERREVIIGLWAGISGLGLAVGPLVGGAIVNGLSWNVIFWVNVPVGIAAVTLGWLRLDESFGERQPLDVGGLLLVGGGLFRLTFGLIRGNTLGWTSYTILGSFVGGALLLAAFVLRERRVTAPMLDLVLFRARAFSAANLSGFAMGAGMFGSIFLLTLYVQQVLGASPLEAGLRTMPWTGTVMLAAPLAGLLAGRIGVRPVVTTGLLLQAGTLAWIATIAGFTTPYNDLLLPFILGGVGVGLTFAPLSAAVMSAVSERHQGQASGAYNAIRELGGVFGVAVLGAIFQHIATTPAQFVDGFHAALLVGAAVVGLGAVASLFLPGAVRRPAAPAELAELAELAPFEISA